MSSHHISVGVLYGAAFVIAGIVSGLATPLVVRLAIRLGIVDDDGAERRMHDQPKPRVGGIAVFFGFAFALFTVLGISSASPFALLPANDQFDAIHKLVGLLFGSLLILGVGVWDDVMHMRARNKFVAQIVVALTECAAKRAGDLWMCPLVLQAAVLKRRITQDAGRWSLRPDRGGHCAGKQSSAILGR